MKTGFIRTHENESDRKTKKAVDLYDLVTEYQSLRKLGEDDWKKAIEGFTELDKKVDDIIHYINDFPPYEEKTLTEDQLMECRIFNDFDLKNFETQCNNQIAPRRVKFTNTVFPDYVNITYVDFQQWDEMMGNSIEYRADFTAFELKESK